MATKLNSSGSGHAASLISSGKIKDSDSWSPPSADAENSFIEKHSISEFGKWYLGIDTDQDPKNKGHYKFPFSSDFKSVDMRGLAACSSRAGQAGYSDIQSKAHDLLEKAKKKLESKSGSVSLTRAVNFFRHFTFDRAQLNESERTVPVCFSSENPVDRGDYDEVLDHSKDGMDLVRLNDSHPVLLNHDPDKQIGVVERAELNDGDKKGRALIRFGRSDLAQEIFNDVKDGIRKHMSVGYERLRTMATETAESGRRCIRFAWRPFELSIVPVPADPTVGVGRSSGAIEAETRSIGNQICVASCRTALAAANDALGELESCDAEDSPEHQAAIGAVRDAIAALAIVIEDANFYTLATAAQTCEACEECAEYCEAAVMALRACGSCGNCGAEANEAIEELEEAAEACEENAGVDDDDDDEPDGTQANTSLEPAQIIAEGQSGGTTVDADTRGRVDGSQSPNAQVTETILTMSTAAAPVVVDQNKVIEIENRARDAERERVKQIRAAVSALFESYKDRDTQVIFRDMADEAVAKGTSKEDFNAELLKKLPGVRKAELITAESLGMSAEDKSKYSLTRAIQCNIKAGKAGRPDGLEGEVHDAMEQRMRGLNAVGGGSGGFLVPANMGFPETRRNINRRDLNVTTFGQGGAFVQTTVLTPIIEILRNRMTAQRLGVVSMAGLEGNIAIPRQTGAATAYTLPETNAITVSTQAIDQVLLTPHRVGAVGKYSKQLLLQSSVDVENFLRDDLMKVLAIKWDKLILEGAGANSEPTGVLNTTGIGSVTFGGTITYAKIVSFETQLALANADIGAMAYITTPSVREKAKTTAKIGSTFPIFIWEDGDFGDGTNDGEMNGYRAACTNQISSNAVAFGHWADVIHALWGGFDVVVNPYSFDVNAEVQITVNTFGDVAVRHAASFAWSSDAGNQ